MLYCALHSAVHPSGRGGGATGATGGGASIMCLGTKSKREIVLISTSKMRSTSRDIQSGEAPRSKTQGETHI